MDAPNSVDTPIARPIKKYVLVSETCSITCTSWTQRVTLAAPFVLRVALHCGLWLRKLRTVRYRAKTPVKKSSYHLGEVVPYPPSFHRGSQPDRPGQRQQRRTKAASSSVRWGKQTSSRAARDV